MITEQAMEQMEQLTMEMEKLLASVIIQRDKAVAALRGGQGIVFDDGYEVNVAALRKQVADLDAQLSEALAALKMLVTRLDEVHADGRYQGVWTMYQIHGGKYDGPTYTRTLAKARAVLARLGADDD